MHQRMVFWQAGSCDRAIHYKLHDPYQHFRENLFGTAGCFVEVHSRIELKESENVCLSGVDRFRPEDERFNFANRRVVNADSHLSNFQVRDQPAEIYCRVLCSAHQSVATHVVEAIRVKLTGDNGVLNSFYAVFLNNISHIVRESGSHLI